MPSKCFFEFDRPEPIYYGGEVINGKIILTTTSKKTVNEVYIQVKGKAKVQWEKSSGGRTRTYRGKELYLDSRTVVYAEGELAAGTYTYTYSVPLPEQCPTSCETKHGKIEYKVSLVLDRPWRFDNVFKKPITVLRVFNLNLHPELLIPVRQEEIKSVCCWPCNSGLFVTTLTIPFGGYAPGQDIKYTLDIDNQSSGYDTVGYRLFLVQIYKLVADDPYKKKKERVNKLVKIEQDAAVLRLTKREFTGSLPIPATPPTSQGDGIMTVRYVIDMSIITGECHKNVRMTIPITIGTIPLMQSVSNPRPADDMLRQSSYESNPPTYERAINPPTYERALNEHSSKYNFTPQYPMYPNAPTAPPELPTLPLRD